VERLTVEIYKLGFQIEMSGLSKPAFVEVSDPAQDRKHSLYVPGVESFGSFGFS
jgi:hypothetical protein